MYPQVYVLQLIFFCYSSINSHQFHYFASNQLENCIFSPNLSISSMPNSLQIDTSGIELLVWSPPLANAKWQSLDNFSWMSLRLSRTVLSWSIDKKTLSTLLIFDTIKTLSSSFWTSFEPFKVRWWSLLTITISLSPQALALLKYSICPLWIGLWNNRLQLLLSSS